MEKGRNCSPQEQFLLFSTIFYNLILDFCVITRTRFFLRDKRLFEITKVEITRVDCNSKNLFQRWFLYPPDKQPSFNPNKTTLQWLHEDYINLHPADLPLECTINQGEVTALLAYYKYWDGLKNVRPEEIFM